MFIFEKFNRKKVAILLMVSALICLALSAAWSIYSWHLVSTATRTTGRIARLVERPGREGTFFYPVFTFTDRHGIEHTVYSGVGTYPPPHQVGDTVIVLYSPGAEKNARLDDWSDLWGVPLTIASLGVFNLIVGIVIYLWPTIVQSRKIEIAA